MTSSPTFGRLERVTSIREYWPGEAQHFTPWLASPENITLVGEAIGVELEVMQAEANVGPFRADILCKDTLNGHFVLIENQLERTDHIHLGQLLTYAAGLDAVTIVWVATSFTDEHRAALDWLNRMTVESANFFGLEIELWRIGDSLVAPKFNVVSKPNDWSESIAQEAASSSSSELTEMQKLHLQFWTQFRQFMEARGSTVHMKKPSKDQWTTIALGRTDFTIVATNGMRDGYSQIHLALLGPNAKGHFRALRERYGDRLDADLGPLDWRELPDRKESQLAIRRTSTPVSPATWDELNEWFAERIERWVEVLRPIVATLQPEPDEVTLMAEDDHDSGVPA